MVISFAGLIVGSRYVSWDSCRIERNMDIGPGEEVLLCDTLDIVISDIRNKSLAEAWRELLSSSILREILDCNPCPGCPLSEKCRGGCYAGHTGSMECSITLIPCAPWS